MPYGIKPSGDKFVVYNTDTDKPVPGGEHATRADALAHQRALMVNVKDANKGSEPSQFGGPGSGRHAGSTLAERHDELKAAGYKHVGFADQGRGTAATTVHTYEHPNGSKVEITTAGRGKIIGDREVAASRKATEYFDKNYKPCKPSRAAFVRVEQNGVVAFSDVQQFGGPGSGRHPEGRNKEADLHKEASEAHARAEQMNKSAGTQRYGTGLKPALGNAARDASLQALNASKAAGVPHLITLAEKALAQSEKGNYYTASNVHGDARSMHSTRESTSRLGGPGPARGEPMYNLGRRVK